MFVSIVSCGSPDYVVDPINIFHAEYYSQDAPYIRLYYQNGNHYDAIIDPKNPTFGVGLGLPGLKPGFFF